MQYAPALQKAAQGFMWLYAPLLKASIVIIAVNGIPYFCAH
jgi:hypothetical protein